MLCSRPLVVSSICVLLGWAGSRPVERHFPTVWAKRYYTSGNRVTGLQLIFHNRCLSVSQLGCNGKSHDNIDRVRIMPICTWPNEVVVLPDWRLVSTMQKWFPIRSIRVRICRMNKHWRPDHIRRKHKQTCLTRFPSYLFSQRLRALYKLVCLC